MTVTQQSLDAELALVHQATSRLLQTAAAVDDAEMRARSELPGWSIGHVLTHVARNGESHLRRARGALEGHMVPQYVGGSEGRNAEIEGGASRPAREVLADLRSVCDALAATWAEMTPEAWARRIDFMGGEPRPAATGPTARLVEVEVHHVDLGRGYQPADWLAAGVNGILGYIVAALARRAGDVRGEKASWHLHRTDGEGEWVVRRDTGGSTVSAKHVKADCAVRGPGYALVAWLMGRRTLAAVGLDVVGDTELAATLPGLYPYD
ncbi:MAG: maleylpyruvate isomerase family mycothiol-dependent enzyme [Chloroflexi bacterium]|nr:MAG: maleylpyruvate isomerase family mycothiol-dependent enzyme [Chloroflexota bacterium]